MPPCSAPSRASRKQHPVELDIHIEVEANLPEDDDERTTQAFLPAVSGEIDGRAVHIERQAGIGRVLELPAIETHLPDSERADRLLSDAALSADEAARNELQRRVVAPLLMLLALGLLIGAGWSC